ncbi:hypothetical protein Tco_0157528 [Tanacetum coccineum]
MDWLRFSSIATIDLLCLDVIFWNVLPQPEFVYHGSSRLRCLREIEFGHCVIHGAEPISKALHIVLATVELKELRQQLQDRRWRMALFDPTEEVVMRNFRSASSGYRKSRSLSYCICRRHHYGSSKVEVYQPNGRDQTTVTDMKCMRKGEKEFVWRNSYMRSVRVLRNETEIWCCSDIDYSIRFGGFQIYSDASKKERLDVELGVTKDALWCYWASMRIESNSHATDQRSQRERRCVVDIVQNIVECTSAEVMTEAHSSPFLFIRFIPDVQRFETVLLAGTSMRQDGIRLYPNVGSCQQLQQLVHRELGFCYSRFGDSFVEKWDEYFHGFRYLSDEGPSDLGRYVEGLLVLWIGTGRLGNEYLCLEFQVGDRCILNVLAYSEEVKRFGIKGICSVLDFIGPFEILERILESFRIGLALPPSYRTFRCTSCISFEGIPLSSIACASYLLIEIQPDYVLCPRGPDSNYGSSRGVMRNKLFLL